MNTKTAEEQIKDFLKKEEWREGDTDTFDYNGLIEFLGKFAAQSAPLATEGRGVWEWVKESEKMPPINEFVVIKDTDGKVYTDACSAWDHRVTDYEWLSRTTLPSQLEGNTLKQVQKLRDELFESLPTGKVSAFDLIGIIANHIEKLDNLSTLTAPIPAEREGKDAVRFGKFLREHGFQTMNGIMQNMTTTELYQRYKQYLSTLK